MSKKIYTILSIVLLGATSGAYASGTGVDPYGNLAALLGGGDSAYSQQSDSNTGGRYDNRYGYSVQDDNGNLAALLGGGDRYSDRPVSPE